MTNQHREPQLSQQERERYSRHLVMPEIGALGQQKLKGASVLQVGTGGLGSAITPYLAAAGIGRMGLVDSDAVDVSNLQRQVLYTQADVGQPKLEAARARLSAMNPALVIETYQKRLDPACAMEILKEFDVIVDGTDNYPSRYLINDACALLGKPYVYGAVFRFQGQASVFDASKGPCYRCLYPEPPPDKLILPPDQGGVIGVLPGIIGTIQAAETIKLILGKPDTLISRLLDLDALKMRFRELKLSKRPDCPLCGLKRTLHALSQSEACHA